MVQRGGKVKQNKGEAIHRATDNMPSCAVKDRDCDQGNCTRDAQEETETMGDRDRKFLATNFSLLTCNSSDLI